MGGFKPKTQPLPPEAFQKPEMPKVQRLPVDTDKEVQNRIAHKKRGAGSIAGNRKVDPAARRRRRQMVAAQSTSTASRPVNDVGSSGKKLGA